MQWNNIFLAPIKVTVNLQFNAQPSYVLLKSEGKNKNIRDKGLKE